MKEFIKINTNIIKKIDIINASVYILNIEEKEEDWEYNVEIRYKYFDGTIRCLHIMNEEKGELSRKIAEQDLNLLYNELNS